MSQITNFRFAQWCTRLAAKSSGWAGDILDPPTNQPGARASNVSFEKSAIA